jgi:ferredoxin
MPFVVTENCIKCRFTDCVSSCPVDCFYADQEMLYIHPDECIDCGACEPACPVQAIYDVDDLPVALAKWEQINEDRVQDEDTYNIYEEEDPLPTADEKRAKLGF